ncbi:MAG: ribonuclease PH [Candidatus Auribacter fodinae]|jgi:ribonuclease PH|uniref:Ribonuclease PH n=1 Tax=Candidatus Auribacter fodinae TaxID=2093366 RepID=A0A3A4R3U7_9BACT|nr:MAG: ribonuclease PH [Candidatus Auribacter fodinae]
MRPDKRLNNQLRPVKITPHFLDYPLGSVLIEFGNTKVLCSVSVEEGLPKWIKEEHGWVTAEYSMLPAAGPDRMQREVSRGKIGGRTHEIQRLIGRAFRSVIDLNLIGPRTIWVDCDVLQADGGTRTASITGGFTALLIAVHKLMDKGVLTQNPVKQNLAAVSVGIVDGEVLLDLNYEEDSSAEVDMNVVMTGSGELVEVQGTAEGKPFSKDTCIALIDYAHAGIKELLKLQNEIVGK